MEIALTDRRKQIDELFSNEDWEGVGRMGIVMKEGPAPADCGAYVLTRLGFTSTQETISVMWAAPRSSVPLREKCIIVYRFHDKPVILQHGIYQDGKVLSRWGSNKPVFLHDIADVPTEFGNLVEFIKITGDLQYKLQQAMYGRIAGPDYY